MEIIPHLGTPLDYRAHLVAAGRDGDPARILRAVADIAQAMGLPDAAAELGRSYTALRRVLARDDLRLSGLKSTLYAIGFRCPPAPSAGRTLH